MQLFHSSASMDVPYKPNSKEYELAKNTGMNEHIAKPLDMNKLNDVLENWL